MSTTKIMIVTKDGLYYAATEAGESPTILRVSLFHNDVELYAFSEDEYDIYRLARDLKDCQSAVDILSNTKPYRLKESIAKQQDSKFTTPDREYDVYTQRKDSVTTLVLEPNNKYKDFIKFDDTEYDIFQLSISLKNVKNTASILGYSDYYKLKEGTVKQKDNTMNKEVDFMTPDGQYIVFTTKGVSPTILRVNLSYKDGDLHAFSEDEYDIYRLARDLKDCPLAVYILNNTKAYKLKRDSGKLPVLPTAAHDLLEKGAALLKERGKQYDKSGSERSMKKIVEAFNTITGKNLTVTEGWYFMTILKGVRFFSNPENVHRDSLEDLISYAALMAEEALGGN